MKPSDIILHIEERNSRPAETMPPTIAHQIKRQDEMNDALWEIALQLSLINLNLLAKEQE